MDGLLSCFKYLDSHCRKVEGIYRQSGKLNDIEACCQWINEGLVDEKSRLAVADPHAISSACKRTLIASEPLLSFDLYHHFTSPGRNSVSIYI